MGFENNDKVDSINEPTTSARDCNSSDQNDSSADHDPSNNGSNDAKITDNFVSLIPSFPHIYRQDVVTGEDGMIGIVTEIAGDPESDSSITDDEEDDDDGDEDEDGDGDDYEGDGGEDEGDSREVGDESSNKSGEKNRNPGGFKIGPLPPDQARVLWIDQTESTRSINDLTVIDRGFLHGDFVAAASDPTGQVGVVIDVDIFADVLVHDNSTVKDVSSRELRRVREFAVGDYVVLGPWLGRVDDVLDNVTVLFDDGSVCKVMRADPLRLIPVSKNTLEDGHFPYYPGQRVKASSSVFKNSRWLSGLWRHNRSEGTVTQVTVGSVFIYWIASAGYGPDSATTPAEEQSPKNLKLLSCFAYSNWQLGDWCLYSSPPLAPSSSTLLDKDLAKLELHDSVNGELDSSQMGSGCDSEDSTPEDAIGDDGPPNLDPAAVSFGRNKNNRSNASNESKEPVHETWPLHRKKIRKVLLRRDKKPRKKDEDFERAVIIVNTRTRVDVAWQDGTIERGLSSTSLIPIDNPGDHEFVAEQYVVEKASDNVEDALEPRRVGVVKSVSSKEKTACVRWLKPVSRPEDHREFDNEEIVSVYELEGHPDYDYCHGDVVVRLSPVTISAESAALEMDSAEQSNQQSASDEAQAHETLEDSSANASESFSDLSWVGNISGLKDGDIEVTWADGMVSTVGPQAIYVVGRDDDDSISAESDVSDDAASWETVDDDGGAVSLGNINEEDEQQNTFSDVFSDSEEGRDNTTGRNPALSVPLAAFRFVTRLASGIFTRGQRNSEPLDPDFNDGGEVQAHHEVEVETLEENDCTNEKSIVIDGCNTEAHHSKEEEQVFLGAEDVLDTEEDLKTGVTDASDSKEVDDSSFKRFDIAVDPLDHYYFGTTAQTNGKRWFKKVHQDWSILQNNLPVGIYVRVYEDRMDLLRAVIVGAYGTPYQDGLFFFDFHLPPEYPDVPPSAYYHSGGWRINPNLYEEGKVCLSLLNTWTGRGNEVWDPKSSSILQVLVSLQGLVLNSKPYFNEAGYEKQVGTAEGEKNSLSYNENTFLLGCKTMMFLMRRPPKDFEELVKEHFKKRGRYILKACDAYMKGHLVGSLTEDASLSDKSDANSTSVGFKLMLAKLVSKLFLALSEIGADCDEFKHLQRS